MSIIFGTLERLESESPGSAREQEQRELSNPGAGPRVFPARGLITSLLFIMALANLLLWYWSSQVQVVTPPPAISVVTVQEAPGAPPGAPAAEPTAEKFRDQLQLIVPSGKKIKPVKVAALKQAPTASQAAASDPRPSPQDRSGTDDRRASSIGSTHAGRQTRESHQAKVDNSTPTVVRPASRATPEAALLPDIEEIVEAARLALSRGRYQQALGLLKTLEPVPETRADFWLLKGSAHLAIGQLALAETALETAQSGAPYNAQIGVQRAILKQESGDHKAALDILQPLADRHPNVPEIFLNLGYSQQALGAERAAQRSFRVFLRLTVGRSLYDQQRQAIQDWLTSAPAPAGDRRRP